jgi:hypothetical protein
MKSYTYALLVFVALSCNSKPQNGNDAATTTGTSTPSVSTTPQASPVSADCKREGTVIDKFEQNNAVFERLQNTKTEQEWLRITTKNGGCTIIDSLGNANHESVRFEDWDKDGFKDRINESKWYYEVALFNAQANDFSRPIEGYFSGDQSDYDKARGLKWQFMEDKSGGTYELYKISDLKKLVYCQIHVQEDEDGKPSIEVVNKKGTTDASSERTVIKTDPSLLKATSESLNATVQAYWRKNEAVFLPK